MKQFNILKYRYIAIAISLLIILAGIASIVLHGGLNLGIDFAGGNTFDVQFKQDVTLAEIRDILNSNGFGTNVQRIGSEKENHFKIRIKVTDDDKQNSENISKVQSIYNEEYGETNIDWRKIDFTGPSMSKVLVNDSFSMVLVVLILILIYVLIRFRHIHYSLAAIFALLHDSLILIGIFSILNKEFNTQILAAVLTLIGYSLNDTIVVFSRIRENLEEYKTMSLKEIINKSINDTLSRTFVTSLTTLGVVLSIFFFGGTVLRDFALALAIGILVGTYSSIFIASPVILMLKGKKAK